MIVTVIFKETKGPAQFKSVSLRIDTEDIAEAVMQAIDQAQKVASIPIEEVKIKL